MQIHVLSEVASRRYLEESGIPMNNSVFIPEKTQLPAAAAGLRFPLVMKIVSPKALHKSDVGGVLLGISRAEELARSWDVLFEHAAIHGIAHQDIQGVSVQEQRESIGEMMVGLKRDPTFGPVLVLGSGGVLVELMRDAALGLCPLTERDLDRMLHKVKGVRLLTGYRGRKKGDMAAFRRLVMAVSAMAVSRSDWQEIDLNPVLVGCEGHGAVAVDARVILAA